MDHVLPDGSSFFTASMPLPKTHWIYEETGEPPMGMRTGTADVRRKPLEQIVRDAAKYAIKACTMNGREKDFDPDALVQNMIVGMLGYHTEDGLSTSRPTPKRVAP